MRGNLQWPFPDKEVSSEFIKEVGHELGYEFPEDYIECARINNGSAVIPYYFKVKDDVKVFGTLLSFDKESDDYIIRVFNNYIDTLPKKMVPIVYDPAGNLICFDYKDHEENPIVVFWEHEGAWEKDMLMEEEGLTEEQAEERARENVFYVADSFTDFLNSLYEFDEDDM
ncbi:SMI1/KNR4 family protein [Bacillus carboniphilus]|uniref:SMI1/KNR4 family protein n=1 Tax=Bacillus carboniphilus TaxID=86663 RepID=A0ABY9JV09_9BACI|nr:SMI1/KNR4 family protein [Bacillus carboniphilus]WLR43227.1 SMI1/KNR4 family protein [Bacillus carboniphilus]